MGMDGDEFAQAKEGFGGFNPFGGGAGGPNPFSDFGSFKDIFGDFEDIFNGESGQ
jgi:hypothetical protein